MPAKKIDLLIEQGTTFESKISLQDTNDLPLDITGYIVNSQCRKNYSSTKAYSLGANIPNPVTGEILLQLTPTETGDIPAGRYVYDLEMTDDESKVIRLIEGNLTVTPGVTRD